MAVIVALALLVVGAALLLRGADWFVDGAGDMARALGVSALLVGIILAGLEPEEMLTAAIASGRGAPDLAVGDVIGTNVTIITVALGIAALIAPIPLRGMRRQGIIATVAAIPPVILLAMGYIPRLAGVALLVIFAAYTVILLRLDRSALERREALEALEDDDAAKAAKPRRSRSAYLRRKAGMTLLGLVAMAAGGPLIVEGALRFADVVGLRQGVVGLTLVALGTGAELIALAFVAARKGHADILVGGVIGSFAYNLLVTLGLAAVVRPMQIDASRYTIALAVMVAAHLALLGLLLAGGTLRRWHGALLLALYAGYIAMVVGR